MPVAENPHAERGANGGPTRPGAPAAEQRVPPPPRKMGRPHRLADDVGVLQAAGRRNALGGPQEAAGTAFVLAPNNRVSGAVRRAWAKPRPTRSAIRAAAMKEAMAPHIMTVPITEKP